MSKSSLFDHLPQQIFHKDAKGRYLGCNYAFVKSRTGEESPEYVVGKDDQSLQPETNCQNYQALEKHYRREDEWVMKNGAPLTVCERAWDASLQAYFVVHGRLSPKRDDQGNVCGVLGILMPIARCDDKHLHLILENKQLRLTWREAQCLHFLLGGWSSREIGKLLHVSSKTVEYHWLQARIKFGDVSRAQMIRELLNHQITRLLPDSYQLKWFGKKAD